ncbi:MAG: hypothetical protein CVV19_03240 [Gammaproteobacteria bacterium HGW-Gammaproteobacteria-9]|nr:MAG: hypothetical protein CVV19_03240 [Gammaproteobacteria bacterium HGW-Gammaproteobacteria-9]
MVTSASKRSCSCWGRRFAAFPADSDLLRVGPAALKTGSECSFTASKLRFFACLTRWRSPFGPAFGCYSRWSLRLA